MSITKIVFLHLCILAVQVLYIYLSNKDQLKNNRYLYLIAVPIATAFPAIIGGQDIQAYNLYEYAVIFCMIFVAAADTSIAAVFNREIITDAGCISFTLSYFLICTATAFCGNISMAVRLVSMVFIGAVLFFSIIKRSTPAELLKSVPIAALSFASSWLFIRCLL